MHSKLAHTHAHTNTLSPSCYQLAFPFKPATDSVTTLGSNCTSHSCLIELTWSRNWYHLTHWSWETMRHNASCTPTNLFLSLTHTPDFCFLLSDSSAHLFYLPCYCLWITRATPHSLTSLQDQPFFCLFYCYHYVPVGAMTWCWKQII